MNKDERMKLPKLTSLDDLLSTQEERDEKNTEKITMVETKNLFPFKNHPFQVRDDDEMDNLVESIQNIGVKTPLRIRAIGNGNYEIISGHRRLKAGLKAGIDKFPCIIENMNDDEAIIVMVDSNLQREKILPSEKAFAYKMRLEAMKRQGQRTDLTSRPMGEKSTSADRLGEEVGESGRQIQRYIRLTELIPEFLEMVDREKDAMALRPAVEISYLTKEEQTDLLDAMESADAMPTHAQAIRIRRMSEKGELTVDDIYDIMEEEKPNQQEKVNFGYNKIKEYFPENYTIDQMMSVMEDLLKNYKLQWQKAEKQKQYTR